jgi:phosphatidylinositol alpha-1,6-mannosyltransferase
MLIAPYFFPRNRGGAVQVYHQLLCNTRAFRFLVVSERRDCSSALLQRFDESSDRLFGYGIRRIAAFELHFNPGTSQWRRVMSGAEFFRKSIQEFDRILGDTCPDLVLCGGTFAAGWLMRRVPSRIPLVTYIHGEELTLGAGPSILQPYFRYCQRRTLRDAALNITVSRYSAGLAISTAKIAPGAVRLLPNFVDTGHFNPPADRDGLRRRLGWSGKTVLLSVARLEPRKGIDQTLRAMASLHHEDRLPRNWLYVIGGCGEQKVVLEELASELGIADRVQFPGRIDKLVAIPRALVSSFSRPALAERRWLAASPGGPGMQLRTALRGSGSIRNAQRKSLRLFGYCSTNRAFARKWDSAGGHASRRNLRFRGPPRALNRFWLPR